ncbi:MAG: hypothetical protein KAI14_05820 [Dehalococcoidales bacterium]|nr:hypothetical protein [Dehalococcoidales bacterium]
MKPFLTIALVSVFLFVALPGCDILEKPDYITVNVDAFANVKVTRWISGQQVVAPWAGTQVEISIVKAGGERVVEMKTTDSGGITQSIRGTFKLYREQYIRVLVSVTPNSAIPDTVGGGGYDPARHILNNSWQELSWSQVYPAKDFGETYNWYTTVHAEADVT